MGLFTNDKKPCPVCGKGTPKLLATKIAGETPICSACEKKVSMQDSKLELLSVDGLKEHLAMREENAKYFENIFRPTKQMELDMTSLNIDEINQVFTIPPTEIGHGHNPTVFKFEELTGYELFAKPRMVERFQRGDLFPEYMPMVFGTLTHLFDDNAISMQSNCYFSLNLYLTNPCWSELKLDLGCAYYKTGIKRNVYARLDELQAVTGALLEIMGYSGATGSSGDPTMEEIAKFKELFDAGVITSEEFEEKKNSLLEE